MVYLFVGATFSAGEPTKELGSFDSFDSFDSVGEFGLLGSGSSTCSFVRRSACSVRPARFGLLVSFGLLGAFDLLVRSTCLFRSAC